jgi:Na+-driven multidrug efflux pump
MMTVSQVVTNNMAAGYGDHVLAAVAVANKSMRMVASAMMGFGQGFQPIAGYCWGAKKYDRVKTAYLYTAAIGVAIGFILGIPLYIFSKQIVGIFSGDPNMLDAGVALMQAQCLALPLHAQSQIATGLFQATGKGVNAAILGLSRQIIALLPCVIILPLIFGLWGLTHAQAAADVLAFLIAIVMVIPMIRQLDRMPKEI